MGSSPTPDSEGDIVQISELTQNNVDISVVPTKERSNLNSPEEHNWTEISTALLKDNIVKTDNNLTLPIILVNDKPPEDLDQKWLKVVDVSHSERLKCFYRRRKFKRRFCRSRRNAVFKRSYSIGWNERIWKHVLYFKTEFGVKNFCIVYQPLVLVLLWFNFFRLKNIIGQF